MEEREHPPRKADRDLFGQLNAVSEAIKAHEAELLKHLPTGSWEDIGHLPEISTDIELYDPTTLRARIEEAQRGDEKGLKAELVKARALGATRQVARPPELSSLQRLQEDFPHFKSVIKLVTERRAVANLTPGRPYKLPPILLAGGPGVGKTAFAEALAACLAQPIKRIDVATSTAGFALAGSHESWSSGRHGAIWSLLQHRSAAGVLLLDEIDKASTGNFPVLGCLYGLLESVSARRFVDEYIQVPVDASRLSVVATCNDVTRIDSALLSRFRLFEISQPTPEEIPAIARSVYAQLHAQEPWGQVYPETLPSEVLAVLQPYSPRELSSLLQDAIARAAVHNRKHLLAEDIVVQAEAIAGQRQRAQARNAIGFL